MLRVVMPRADPAWVEPLNDAMVAFAIDQTTSRQAAFLAQVAEESGELHFVREIWGPTAAQLAYEGRKDLGNTQPGDGRKFLGRGPIEITGRGNYANCSMALYGDYRLLDNPELLEQKPDGANSSGWFWRVHNLNLLADAGEFDSITRIINGGLTGEETRLAYWKQAKIALGLT